MVRRPGSKRLWHTWLEICQSAPKRGPEQLFEMLPVAEDYGADVRWVLQRLRSERAIRLHCGGAELTDAAGTVWGQDRFSLGGFQCYPFTGKIVGGPGGRLGGRHRFFGHRHLAGYEIPLPRGRYQVTLIFCENWYGGKDCRRFDVELEGETKLEGYRPTPLDEETGTATVESRAFEITVEDSVLDIDFVRRVGDPAVAAIEIVRLD